MQEGLIVNLSGINAELLSRGEGCQSLGALVQGKIIDNSLPVIDRELDEDHRHELMERFWNGLDFQLSAHLGRQISLATSGPLYCHLTLLLPRGVNPWLLVQIARKAQSKGFQILLTLPGQAGQAIGGDHCTCMFELA